MKLSDTIRFVAPGIGGKVLLPILSHLRIESGYAVSYDGVLALACPIPVTTTCSPHADTFKRAALKVGDDFQSVLMPNGDVVLTGNKVRIQVPCSTEPFPSLNELFLGTPILAGGGLLPILKKLLPFTNELVKERPWMNTVLLRGNHAHATCGYAMAQADLPFSVPMDISVPVVAIDAMVAIKEEPVEIRACAERFTVCYSDGRFLSCPTIQTPWPDLSVILGPRETHPIPEGLFEAIHAIEPFSKDGNLWLNRDTVATVPQDGGAQATVPGLPSAGKTSFHGFRLAEPHALTMDLGGKPIAWAGEGIRGRIQVSPSY